MVVMVLVVLLCVVARSVVVGDVLQLHAVDARQRVARRGLGEAAYDARREMLV